MKYQTGYLGMLLSSTLLVACGGGGGGGTSSDPLAGGGGVGGTDPSNVPATVFVVNPELAKYEGNWHQDCVDHVRLTMTVTAAGSKSLTVTRNQEHFANADCTGAIVANGNYGVPDETVQYTEPLENASVLMTTGATFVANVDPGSSKLGIGRFTYTGSGVVASEFALGATIARIRYADKEVILPPVGAINGQSSSGALLLLKGELLSLVPIENTISSFRVNQRYIR